MAEKPIDERLSTYRSMFRLDGKVAVVLGAASGIGRASAEALAALGATVICADRNKEGVELTARELEAEAIVCDAGEAKEIAALADGIMHKHGRADIAVTTPAVHVRKLLCEYTDEDYDKVANLNLRGTFLFLRAFGRIMREQGSGSLIASSSFAQRPWSPA
jgi:NAD(P)-dependent dehydrogenase (short-subunit alcohol dehydrogenase family)